MNSFLLSTFWTGWRRWAAWLICIGAILLLGALQTATDADFTFASLAILPVLAIAWIGGKRDGLLAAFLAAAMWIMADILSGRQFSTQWIPWTNAITRLMTYILVALLTARVRRQFEGEHQHATRDALTGLQNRRAFLEAGAAEVERAKRYAHSLAVIFLDLDDFKQLNDTKGHAAGDAALRATAQALRRGLRSSDRVARLGGDEFAILLPQIGYDAAVAAGKKISVAVSRALKQFPPVKVSLGIAWFGEVERKFPAMLKAADELMYQVKKSGKHDIRSRSFTEMKKPKAS
ncbi:MAG: GGDEF domain-containing protein [Sterolibacterium sp.]|nr:GGDEF domain-containing protein [Sterolibacterium sp.]